jgi:hypothetical protein
MTSPNQAIQQNQPSRRSQRVTRYERLFKEKMDLEDAKTANYSFREKVMHCLTTVEFVVIMASITCLFVIVTGIQFWITDYMTSVLGIQ